MAQTADKVAVEVEAKLNAASARATAADFDRVMNDLRKSGNKAEAALLPIMENIKRKMDEAFSAGNAAKVEQYRLQLERLAGAAASTEKPFMNANMRTRQLGMQIGQLGSSFGSGMNPLMVLSQQASDFAYVLGGTTGAAGRLATFFSGPWGAALLAAGLVTATLLTKTKEHTLSLDELVEKLRKQHKQTQLNEQADRIWANTIDGLTEAIRKRREEMDKSIQTDIQAERQSVLAAQAEANRARGQAQQVAQQVARQQSIVARRRSELAQAESGAGAGDSTAAAQNVLSATQSLQSAERKLADLRDSYNQLTEAISKAEGTARLAQGVISQRNVENALDPVRTATDNYTTALGQLNDQLKLNIISQEQYDARLLASAKARDAAIKAAQDAAKKPDLDLVPFQRPVTGGRTTGQFGESRPGRQHAGVDIAVPVGTPVSAAAGGVVIESGTIPGYGNVIVIDHGRGTLTRYAHLSQLGAAKGAVVEAGQQIGLSGGARGAPGSGNSRGPHLHYEVRQGGRAVDPLKGQYAADPLSANAKAEQIAAQLERERLKELAQTASFNAEMAQLQTGLVEAMRSRVTSAAQQLEIDEGEVTAGRDKAKASYQAAADQGRITQAQADLLIAKQNELATARTVQLYANEGLRKQQMAAQLDEQRQSGVVSQLQFEEQNTKTAKDRHAAQLRLLDAEIELQRIRLQQIVDATMAGTAEHELAVLKLQQLEDERGRRTASINNDPGNMSPGQRYRDQLNQTAGQIDEAIESATVDGLQGLNDDLTQAIMGTQSLGEAFDNMANTIIQALIKIAIQQAIIKPIADLLFGAGGGAAGGGAGLVPMGGTGGGWISNLIGSIFSGGARASGGPVSAGKAYWVGEHGPEPFIPSQPGMVIPNDAVAALAGAGGRAAPNVYSFTVNAPGATAETVAMIRRELRGAAPTIIAAAQRSTIGQLTRTRT